MLNDVIHQYIKDNITPKDSEKNMVSSRYDELCKMLKGVNLQIGSYARFTAVTPINDLDVLWELPEDILLKNFSATTVATKTIDPATFDITEILKELAQELRTEYAKIGVSIMKIEPRTHSVSIFFGPTEDNFSIDVVPAVPSGTNEYGDSTYWVPEIAEMSHARRKSFYSSNGKVSWIKSDPRGYIKEATELNDSNENYRHVVKFCKKWKWSVKNAYPEVKFKSFHLEMVVKELFLTHPALSTIEGVKLFFSEIKNYINVPKIKDRANNGRYIDDYVASQDQEAKNRLINEGFKAVRILEDLSAASSASIVTEGIRQIFNISTPRQTLASSVVAPISRPYATNYDSK